jgi:nitroimidazol reductase NimA-like FMN-containing flavoprotein (pyridoxamine 5'-phosphate oxidase superfamily)
MKHRILNSEWEIEEIIRHCRVCHVAMTGTDGKPYVVPMNFGYEEGTVYLHSSQTGKKTGILEKNPEVCIAFSTDYQLRYQNEKVACSYSMKYRSVLVYGSVEFIRETEMKTKALDIIMRNYSPRAFLYNPPSLRDVCCWKVRATRMEGRAYGY